MDTIFYSENEPLIGSDPGVFVARSSHYKSSLEFRLDHPDIGRNSKFVVTDDDNYRSIKTYDIFSGKDISDYSESEREAAKKYITRILEIALYFIQAGYHREESLLKVPDWCVTFTEPIMEYLLTYFEIKTEADDIHPADQFLSTPQFRKLVTEILVEVLAHYSVNNQIFEFSEITDWYSLDTWKLFSERIK